MPGKTSHRDNPTGITGALFSFAFLHAPTRVRSMREPHDVSEATMTSAAVRTANRANAARSTGPRTRAGKAKVARNALRHGLNLPALADPTLAAEVVELARRVAGEGAGEARHAAAVR